MTELIKASSQMVAVVATLSLCPFVALAAGPRYAPVELESNFEDRDTRTKRIQPALERAVRDTLQHRHGVEIVQSSKTKVVIFVRDLVDSPDSSAKAISTYTVMVEVKVDGQLRANEPFNCSKMGEAELVECAVGGIAPVLQYLPLKEVDPASQPPVQDPAQNPKPNKRIAPIGPWGVAGIVVGALGVGAAIAGGVYLGRGAPISQKWDVGLKTDYRPLGKGLLGAGLAAVTLGGIAVGVDVGQRAKKREKQKKVSGLRVLPTVGGLSLHGRF